MRSKGVLLMTGLRSRGVQAGLALKGAATNLYLKSLRSVALRAAVVGGGIGGTAAAVALTQAGVDVRVYEQARQLTEVGAGVALAPNGLRMLDRLGVSEQIARLPPGTVLTEHRCTGLRQDAEGATVVFGSARAGTSWCSLCGLDSC